MNVNDLLRSIYEEKKTILMEIPLSKKPTNPLCLSISSDCINKPKIILFGQETNDWYGAYDSKKSVEEQMGLYNLFWFKKERKNSKKGVLMQTFGDLQKAFPDICFVWNNVIKIGKTEKGTPPLDVIEWQNDWFDVLKKEIIHLQPTMMFFFSGPNYDTYIKKAFGEFQLENIAEEPKRKIAKLNFVDYPHIKAYRTYHPNYLRKQEPKYMPMIKKIIENHFSN